MIDDFKRWLSLRTATHKDSIKLLQDIKVYDDNAKLTKEYGG